MDSDAVVLYCHTAIFDFLAFRIETGHREINIVRLPLHWREAGIHRRTADLVNSTALIVPAGQTVAIQHLQLIGAIYVDAAIAAGLAEAVRIKG